MKEEKGDKLKWYEWPIGLILLAAYWIQEKIIDKL